ADGRRLSRADALVVVAAPTAEIQTFFQVGPPRRELTAHREVAAPGSPAARHVNAMFAFSALLEARATQAEQRIDDARLDAVALDVEETELARRPVHLRGDVI